MSDYQRFVSYIYGYVQGERKESVGFVKVDMRGGLSRIRVHMREFYAWDRRPCQIYLFTQQEGAPKKQLLGALARRSGALEWSGAGVVLDGSNGIYIEGNERIFAADWRGAPVDVRRLLEPEPEQKAESEPELRPEPEPEIVSEIEPEQELAKEPEQEAEEIPDLAEDIPVTAEEVKAEESEPAQEGERGEDSRWERWEYLSRHFPVMRCAAGEDSVLCCIHLGIRELMGTPRNHWELGSNSFLLHGCYQYGHLLLLRQKKGEQVIYQVGVPGIHNEREEMLASMFGFEEFKLIRGPGVRTGGLGYWCKTLG